MQLGSDDDGKDTSITSAFSPGSSAKAPVKGKKRRMDAIAMGDEVDQDRIREAKKLVVQAMQKNPAVALRLEHLLKKGLSKKVRASRRLSIPCRHAKTRITSWAAIASSF